MIKYVDDSDGKIKSKNRGNATDNYEKSDYQNTERGKYDKNSKGIYYASGNYEAFARPKKPVGIEEKSAYIVGSGLGALAAACFLVRDAKMPGENIHILEALDIAGGACDGINDASRGYIMRGGREMEDHFECLWDLFRSIPSLENKDESVLDEIRNGNMKVNEKLIDVLFRGLDALESYLAVISSEGNEGTEDNEDIINDLNALLEEQSGDGVAAPAQKEVKKEETPAKEEKAENKQESASDEKCKFKQIPISEYEATAINSARAEGKNVYGITVCKL